MRKNGKNYAKEKIENIRQRIFDPFFTTKEMNKVMGLGLPLAKGIIEAHNGSIILDQESDHTKFVVKLQKCS